MNQRQIPTSVGSVLAVLMAVITLCGYAEIARAEVAQALSYTKNVQEGSDTNVIAAPAITLTHGIYIPLLHVQLASNNEESGNALAVDETYDGLRAGTRLILAYDLQSSAFVGTVENITTTTLSQVRVEVHLSNGKELGPTTAIALVPGQKVDVVLDATGETFSGWTPHAEVGHSTGGGDDNGGGEHDGDCEDDDEGDGCGDGDGD